MVTSNRLSELCVERLSELNANYEIIYVPTAGIRGIDLTDSESYVALRTRISSSTCSTSLTSSFGSYLTTHRVSQAGHKSILHTALETAPISDLRIPARLTPHTCESPLEWRL